MEKMKCPKCPEDIELDRISFGLTDVDQCPRCEGVWFDFFASELTAILERGRDHVPEQLKKSLDADAGRVIPVAEKGKAFLCPRCGVKLRSYWYGSEVGKSFLVDGCTAGCGVWLDDGELGKAFDFLRRASNELVKYYTENGIMGKVHDLLRGREKK